MVVVVKVLVGAMVEDVAASALYPGSIETGPSGLNRTWNTTCALLNHRNLNHLFLKGPFVLDTSTRAEMKVRPQPFCGGSALWRATQRKSGLGRSGRHAKFHLVPVE